MNHCIRQCLVHSFALVALAAHAGVNVLTVQYDNSRSGLNAAETQLTPANVNYRQFGKLFEQVVDGAVNAQPLILTNLAIPGKGTHNVVFVATEHNSVYAFDADSIDGANADPLWQVSFVDEDNGVLSVRSTDLSIYAQDQEFGISGTPVIDAATGTLYAVDFTKTEKIIESSSTVQTTFQHRLHALDVRTGRERPGSPVLIEAATPGLSDTGSGNLGIVPFNAQYERNVCGLLLVNNVVYTVWSGQLGFSNEGFATRGWVIGYHKTSLKQTGVFNTAPDVYGGEVGMAYSGMAADAEGALYLTTGNVRRYSLPSPLVPSVNYGNSALKLGVSRTGALSLLDSFKPVNSLIYDGGFGAGFDNASILLLPPQKGAHRDQAVVFGTSGRAYFMDRHHLGGFNGLYDSNVKTWTTNTGSIFSTVCFNNKLYAAPDADFLRAYDLTSGNMVPETNPGIYTDQSNVVPMVSANGVKNGIVWTLVESGLKAFNAETLSLIYGGANGNSEGADVGYRLAFSKPVVANGKVYAGSQDRVAVFGLFHFISPLVVDVKSEENLTGSGSFTPFFEYPGDHEINKTYTLTAVPDADSFFDGWYEDKDNTLVRISTSPKLTFVMKDSLSLFMSFTRNPFRPIAGMYSGYTEERGSGLAFATANSFALSTAGVFTGRFALGGEVFTVTGKFENNLGGPTFTTTINRKGKPPVTIRLLLDNVNQPNVLTGSITDGVTTGKITSYRAVDATYAGRYTLALPASDYLLMPPQAAGTGIGVITVDARSRLTMGCVLGDGSVITQSTVVGADGSWYFYGAPYRGKGSIMGTLRFQATEDSDITGSLVWQKLITKTPAVARTLSPLGSKYDATKPLLGAPGDSGFLDAVGGGLDLNIIIEKHFTIGPRNTIILFPGVTGMTLGLNPKNGFVKGAFTDNANKVHKYAGVLLQKQRRIRGPFLNGSARGDVTIQLPAAP